MNITGMRFYEFWLGIDKLTNKPELDPNEKVIFRTLDDEYGITLIEVEDGVLVFHSDEVNGPE